MMLKFLLLQLKLTFFTFAPVAVLMRLLQLHMWQSLLLLSSSKDCAAELAFFFSRARD
jgi:hypothetical protein